MKILVLQVRKNDDPMRLQEQRCFARSTGLGDGSLEFVNLVDRVPDFDEVSEFDALMVGGAGHYSVVSTDVPFFPPVHALLRRVVDEGFPTFASCFGFQLMVVALGGEVTHDPDATEVGAFNLALTDDGRQDELFSILPDQFVGQMGHIDRAVSMPPGVANLASSKLSPLQALRIADQPIWASQFHPELDQQSNLERYQAYMERYVPQGEDGNEGTFVSLPSPEASKLLPAFLELIGTE